MHEFNSIKHKGFDDVTKLMYRGLSLSQKTNNC